MIYITFFICRYHCKPDILIYKRWIKCYLCCGIIICCYTWWTNRNWVSKGTRTRKNTWFKESICIGTIRCTDVTRNTCNETSIICKWYLASITPYIQIIPLTWTSFMLIETSIVCDYHRKTYKLTYSYILRHNFVNSGAWGSLDCLIYFIICIRRRVTPGIIVDYLYWSKSTTSGTEWVSWKDIKCASCIILRNILCYWVARRMRGGDYTIRTATGYC